MPGPERWLSTVHPGDRQRLQATVESLCKGQLPLCTEEYRIVLPDETVRWVRDRVHVRRLEGNIRVDGVVSDITERKHVEEALRESEERYRRLSKWNPMPSWSSKRRAAGFWTRTQPQ